MRGGKERREQERNRRRIKELRRDRRNRRRIGT